MFFVVILRKKVGNVFLNKQWRLGMAQQAAVPRATPEGFGRDTFLAPLAPILSPMALEHVHAAYVFAKYGHRNQTRDEGNRYFEHPKAVANILIHELGFKNDWRIIATALLHDILEDTYLLSEDRIRRNFGKTVASWVKLLSKVPKEGYHERLANCGIWEVLLVKLCDRMHNLSTFAVWDEKRKRKYLQETADRYAPLADTLIALIPRRYVRHAERLKSGILRHLA